MTADTILRLARVAICVVLGWACAACVASQPIQAGIVPETAASAQQAPVDTGSYVLRPADVIQVAVFREADLSLASVGVAADGQVSFPLVGPVTVAGLTATELERLLEAELGSRYLRDPDVTVNVLEYASHTVTVEGAVEQPGIYTFRPGTRLSGGVAMAKGVKRVAAMRDVALFRAGDAGMQVAKFDLAAVSAGTLADPVLRPGDRIVVGTDNLAQFWQDLLRALPAFGLFTQL